MRSHRGLLVPPTSHWGTKRRDGGGGYKQGFILGGGGGHPTFVSVQCESRGNVMDRWGEGGGARLLQASPSPPMRPAIDVTPPPPPPQTLLMGGGKQKSSPSPKNVNRIGEQKGGTLEAPHPPSLSFHLLLLGLNWSTVRGGLVAFVCPHMVLPPPPCTGLSAGTPQPIDNGGVPLPPHPIDTHSHH